MSYYPWKKEEQKIPGKKKRGKDNIPILLYTESEEKNKNQNRGNQLKRGSLICLGLAGLYACFVVENARAPRHFLFGKGHKIYIVVSGALLIVCLAKQIDELSFLLNSFFSNEIGPTSGVWYLTLFDFCTELCFSVSKKCTRYIHCKRSGVDFTMS